MPRPHSRDDIISCLRPILEEERLAVERFLAQRHEDVLARLQLQLLDAQSVAGPPWPPEVAPCVRLEIANSESLENGDEQSTAASSHELPSSKTDVEQASTHRGSEEDRHERIKKLATRLELVAEEPRTPSPSISCTSLKDFLILRLELVSGILVCLYVVLTAIMTEYRGIDLAHVLSSDNVTEFQDSRPATEVWPGAQETFLVLEWLFGLLCCMELATRLLLKINLWQDRYWNMFDSVIIVAFFIERFDMSGLLPFDPAILRAARLLRLMRLLKLVRFVKAAAVGPLQLMVTSIMSAMSVLSWTIVLIFLLISIVAVVNASLIDPFIRDPSQDAEVIISVFIQHTFKTASHDEDVMIAEKAKAGEVYLKHLDTLFGELDERGAGIIEREEFEAALQQPRVKHWFAALEIDGSRIFELLDDGNGEIDKASFITGLRKIKGAAQSIDMIRVRRDLERIRAALEGRC